MSLLTANTVDRIRAEAAAIRPVRTLLLSLAAVLYGVGWLAGKTLGVVWAGVAWSVAAVKVGWAEAKGGRSS
jgi:hypothetical protein